MRFEFHLPAPARGEPFGALIRREDGECQAPETLFSPPLFGGVEEGTPYTLSLCFARHRENRHVTTELIRRGPESPRDQPPVPGESMCR